MGREMKQFSKNLFGWKKHGNLPFQYFQNMIEVTTLQSMFIHVTTI